MRMLRQKNRNKKGFTIIEVVVSIAIFAVISMALFSMFDAILKTVRNNKAMLAANSIASEQLEIMRGMEFNNVATVEGWGGPIPSERTISRSGTDFDVKVDITWVDDPFDGVEPEDTFPYDYKNARVRVSWKNPVSGSDEEFAASTFVVPPGLEGLSKGRGGLYLTAFDSNGKRLSGATAKISSTKGSLALTERKTDLNGNIWLPDLLPADDYHIEVAKEGYNSSQTYAIDANPASANYNPIPEKTNALVVAQQVTKMGFSIDKLGILDIKTFHFSNPSNWRVNADAAGEQTDSSAALGSDGQLFVAFMDTRETGSYIYLQKFTYNAGSGTYQGSWSDIKVTDQPTSANPELKFTQNGSLFLAWDDGSDVYLQRIDPANGGLIGSALTVNHDAAGKVQKNPSMDADQDGNLCIAWEDYRSDNWDVYLQKFNTSLNSFRDEDFKVSVLDADGQELNPKIILDRDTNAEGANLNNLYVFWQGDRSGSFDIFLSKFDVNFQAAISEKQINENGGFLDQYEPAAAYDGSEYFYVAWSDERDSQPDIYMQKIDKSGNLMWTAGDLKINDDAYATARRTKPSIGYGGSEAIYVTWEDNRNGEAYSDIYASKIKSSGERLWIYDLVVADYLASVQTNASTVCDAGGKAVTVWQDNRNGTNDIFAARYSEMGNLQMPGVEITVTGERAKGKYPNPAYVPEGTEPEFISIPKYSEKFTSDANGNIHIGGIEWGSYAFFVDENDYIIASFDLPSPIAVAPGGSSHIVINVNPEE